MNCLVHWLSWLTRQICVAMVNITEGFLNNMLTCFPRDTALPVPGAALKECGNSHSGDTSRYRLSWWRIRRVCRLCCGSSGVIFCCGSFGSKFCCGSFRCRFCCGSFGCTFCCGSFYCIFCCGSFGCTFCCGSFGCTFCCGSFGSTFCCGSFGCTFC